MIDSSYHNKKHEAADRHWRELTTRVECLVVQTLNLCSQFSDQPAHPTRLMKPAIRSTAVEAGPWPEPCGW
jgi:hypothetical protein